MEKEKDELRDLNSHLQSHIKDLKASTSILKEATGLKQLKSQNIVSISPLKMERKRIHLVLSKIIY